jgi:hypothetical protein
MSPARPVSFENVNHPTRTLCALLVAGLAEAAYGNAKVVRSMAVVLATEKVNGVIADDTAAVKGEFVLSGSIAERTKNLSKETRVYFPLFAPRGTNWTIGDFKFDLELNRARPASYAISPEVPFAVPESEDYSVVWLVARFPHQISRRRLHLNVSYEQRLLNGVFYYLPIVEGRRRGSEGLSITVKSDRPIHSEGRGPGGCVAAGPRKLVFLPAHLGMVVVSTKPEPKDAAGR